MKNTLTVVGACIWIPIWIFSYTGLAKQILNDPKNIEIAIAVIIAMLIGIAMMFIGIMRKY